MVYILDKLYIKKEFLKTFNEGYELTLTKRQEFGCQEMRYFTNINNKSLITVLSQWDDFDGHQAFFNKYDKEYLSKYQEGAIEVRVLRKLSETKVAGSRQIKLYVLSEIQNPFEHSKTPEEISKEFNNLYSPEVLERIGSFQLEIYMKEKYDNILYLLGGWRTIDDYDNWLKSQYRVDNLQKVTPLHYLLDLQDDWKVGD